MLSGVHIFINFIPRQGLFVLFVHSPQLPCFFLVITDISPRCAIDPDGVRITEFADQDIPVKIRYHGYIPGIPAVTEPGRVVIRELYDNHFDPAFLRIINTLFHMLCLLSVMFFTGAEVSRLQRVDCSLHDDLHGLEVIPSYFRVGYPAVTLGGSDGVVPQEILDRRKSGVSIQHLRSHRMAKMVTGDFQVCSAGIIFHPFLDPTD